jgi:nucleotide-binding universal stress UspA family protein
MTHHGAIVVGLGAQREPGPELEWAAREAHVRNRPLHIVHGYYLAQTLLPWDNMADRTIESQMRESALRRVRRAVSQVKRGHPDLQVTGVAAHGIPWEVLGHAAATAEMTVVGSRRHGVLGSAVLGSVSTVVAARGPGPIIVAANPPGDPAENPAVVVGLDGSPAMDDVLAFAFDYASAHRRPLRAIFCWHPDLLAGMQWRGEPPAPERAERWLAEATSGWQEKYPDVRLSRGVVRAFPAAGLIAESLSQELLVVGTHSHHARIAALLGSVSQGVLHNATCPVAVVHPRDDTAR